MKIATSLVIAACLSISILCGCNSHNSSTPNQTSPKSADKEKLDSFQESLSLAQTNLDGSVEECKYIIQHAHEDGIMSHYDKSVAYSRYAASEVSNAKDSFDYIYINYKNVPTSLKDDFIEYQRIIDDNVIFIPNISQGTYSDDKIPGWVDDWKKAGELYQSINLEIERLKKD